MKDGLVHQGKSGIIQT